LSYFKFIENVTEFPFVQYINMMLPHALCSSSYRGPIFLSDHAQAYCVTYSVDVGCYFPKQMPPPASKVTWSFTYRFLIKIQYVAHGRLYWLNCFCQSN